MSFQPKWIDEIEEPKGLIVVAHPDDETIFSGGLIQTINVDWTIFCCIHEHNVHRQEEFNNACNFLSTCSGNSINPLYLGITPENIHKLYYKIQEFATNYDIVLTHNQMGEYGHEHHKAVHKAVLKEIKSQNIWFFISPGSSNVNQDLLKSKYSNGNRLLKLSPKKLYNKIKTFQDFYPSQSKLYGYDENGLLRNSQLKETLEWQFESGYESFTFFK